MEEELKSLLAELPEKAQMMDEIIRLQDMLIQRNGELITARDELLSRKA